LVSRGQLSNSDKKMVDSFADKLRAMLPDIEKLGKYQAAGSQLSPGRLLSSSPTGSAYGVIGAVAGQPLLALPVGAEAGLAYSIMNPSGVFRKWLTTGLKLPKIPAKMGIMKTEEEYLND
jgi:hypothetical protein